MFRVVMEFLALEGESVLLEVLTMLVRSVEVAQNIGRCCLVEGRG